MRQFLYEVKWNCPTSGVTGVAHTELLKHLLAEKKQVCASFCSTNLDLRFSLALCDKEKRYRQTRRERVMLGIKKLLDMEKPRFLPTSPEEVGTWIYYS